MFALTHEPLDTEALRAGLSSPACGAVVCFEGKVRDHNHGRAVLRLEYEAYAGLAIKEGERILTRAMERFGVDAIHCVHRLGLLEVGETAIWVGVAAAHRRAAFEACMQVMDEIKATVPVWKREHYADGETEWVGCAGCSVKAMA